MAYFMTSGSFLERCSDKKALDTARGSYSTRPVLEPKLSHVGRKSKLMMSYAKAPATTGLYLVIL